MDTNVPQHKATHKRLGILRKLIYSCNHKGRVPQWDDMLSDVDRQYVTEYGIAERQGRVFRVLKDWNLLWDKSSKKKEEGQQDGGLTATM
jgi:hypothetical protein